MKVLMTIGITALVDLDERVDMTMKIGMPVPKLSVSSLHVPGAMENPPDPQQANEYNVIALHHVLSYLANGAKERLDEIGSAPTQLGGQA